MFLVLMLAAAVQAREPALDPAPASTGVPLPQQSAPSEPLPSIDVSQTRNPLAVPYRKGYELADKVRQAGDGLVAVMLQVTSAGTKGPEPGLALTVEGDRVYENVQISSEGFFRIPMNREALDANADFVVNRKKGSLNLAIYLVPELPAPPLTYGTIVRAIQGARAARKSIVPWYLRWLAADVHAVSLCFAQGDALVRIQGPGASERAAQIADTDLAGKPELCADITDKEKGLADDSVLTSTQTWDAKFVGAR